MENHVEEAGLPSEPWPTIFRDVTRSDLCLVRGLCVRGVEGAGRRNEIREKAGTVAQVREERSLTGGRQRDGESER